MVCNNETAAELVYASYEISGKQLLKNISLNLMAGNISLVIGQNGAGKTSLLRLLSNDVVPTSGTIRYAFPKTKNKDLRHRAKHLAVLPQFSLLNFPYCVEEVVALGRTPHNSGKDVDEEIVNTIIKLLDLSELRSKLYTQLSGGEKQRTQIARVLAQVWRKEDAAQRMLLLDEPNSAMDMKHQAMLGDMLKEKAREGLCVVIVAHNFNFASNFVDNIIALKDGALYAQGAPKDILKPKILKEVFDTDLHVGQHPATGDLYVV